MVPDTESLDEGDEVVLVTPSQRLVTRVLVALPPEEPGNLVVGATWVVGAEVGEDLVGPEEVAVPLLAGDPTNGFGGGPLQPSVWRLVVACGAHVRRVSVCTVCVRCARAVYVQCVCSV